MRKQALIVAGTNKSGTTSLFRYLSDHPQICPSRTKELQFFLSSTPILQNYQDEFGSKSGATITLEASPQYMDEGPDVVQRIHNLLPTAKLIFLLREPVARLRSFFESYQSRDSDLVKGYEFTSFVDDALNASANKNQEFQRELNRGCYADHLEHWLSVFEPRQIHVLFFDALSRDSRKAVQDICSFAALDPSIYDQYQFNIENKTRRYRYSSLHRIAHGLNRSMEPFLNRHRGIKEAVRRLYTSVNEDKRREVLLETEGERAAKRFYRPHNQKLRNLVKTKFPATTPPDWLGE